MSQRLREEALKIAFLTFFGGFFIGYTMRLFDIIPVPFSFESLFPIYSEAVFAMKERGYEYAGSFFIPESLKYKPDFLDVIRNSILLPILLVGSSVLFAIPTIIILFVSGISAGSAFAEIIEFAPLSILLKFFASSAVFIASLLFSASIGFYICSYIFDIVRSREFKTEKGFYDYALYMLGLIILSMFFQYFLMVR